MRASEENLYALGDPQAGTALLARALLAQGGEMARLIRSLSGARTPVDTLAFAERAAALFAVQVAAVTDHLLPALIEADDAAFAAAVRATEARAGELTALAAESGTADGGAQGDAAGEVLDVRTIAHGGSRHEVIFARLGALAAGEHLVIVNDHDPKPLRYQMDAAWPSTYDWDYLISGPDEWRITITRRA